MNNMPSSRPVDFDALVKRMKADGAFDAYEQPLGKTDASSLSSFYHNPGFPGDFSFGLGTLQVASGINIPQDLANAQHKSFSDALAHYMPQETVAQWMHEYFATDFLHSKSFRDQITAIGGMNSKPDKLLDSRHTMQLDAKERNTGENRLYTAEEIELTQKVCAKVPALAISVFAYQASFVAYLDKLEESIRKSKTLSKEQKERGNAALSIIKLSFADVGFYHDILPAIATHYAKNHEGKIGEPATAEDFNQAMVYVMKHGFRANLKYKDESGSVQLTCPAHKAIGQSSIVSLDDASAQAPAQEDASLRSRLGTSLFHIYRAATQQIHERPRSFAITRDTLEKSIERALSPDGPGMMKKIRGMFS